MKSGTNLIKPQKLQKGDTIGIISPAGVVDEDASWESVSNYFKEKGYKVKFAPHVKDKKAYLAGNDQDRLDDLMSFFEDDEIKVIICSRGGYGTFRLLENIDYEKIRKNPKIFVGYSDITALLLAFLERSNLVTFHGPLALSDFGVESVNSYTELNFFHMLEGKLNIPYRYFNPVKYECITPREARGQLVGGNLSILSGLLGTPFFPDLKNKILLLEDIGEPLYRIDRMLMQLKLAGVFKQISGLLFGDFTSIVKTYNPEIDKFSTLDVIKELTQDLNIPIGYGFSASHADSKTILPFGVEYYFNSGKGELILEENYLI